MEKKWVKYQGQCLQEDIYKLIDNNPIESIICLEDIECDEQSPKIEQYVTKDGLQYAELDSLLPQEFPELQSKKQESLSDYVNAAKTHFIKSLKHGKKALLYARFIGLKTCDNFISVEYKVFYGNTASLYERFYEGSKRDCYEV